MKENFEVSLKLTLVYEGGWSDHPADPGGATMRGVTQSVYDDDRDSRRLPRQSVRLITDAELHNIYRRRYWQLVGADALPGGVDYAMFDFAVNSGVGRAVKTAQAVVGMPATGVMSAGVVQAVLEFVQVHGVLAATDGICHARAQFLRSLKTFGTFGRGWMRRVMGETDGRQMGDSGVIDRAWSMANGDPVWAPSSPAATIKTYLSGTTK